MNEQMEECNVPMGKSACEFVSYAVETFLRGVNYAAHYNSERALLLPLVILDERNALQLFELFRAELLRTMNSEASRLKTLLTAEEAGRLAHWTAAGFRRRATQEGCPPHYVTGEKKPRYRLKDVLAMLTGIHQVPKDTRATYNARLAKVLSTMVAPGDLPP